MISDARGFGDELLRLADGGLGADDMEELVNISIDQLYDLNRGSVSAPDKRLFKQGVLQRGGWWDTQATAETPLTPRRQMFRWTPPSLPSTDGLCWQRFHLVRSVERLYEGRHRRRHLHPKPRTL